MKDNIMYDKLFKNALIVDGTGNTPFQGSIGVIRDNIVDVGYVCGNGRVEIDCCGLTVTPGFIDIHNHSDMHIFMEPHARNYISQGITTLVVGNCGASAAPVCEKNKDRYHSSHFLDKYISLDSKKLFSKKKYSFYEYLSLFNTVPVGINIAPLVGFGNIRSSIMGFDNRIPSQSELNKMKDLISHLMRDGAFGVSTGLIYDPDMFAQVEELTEIAKTIHKYDGLYASHIRSESYSLIPSIIEPLEIGLKTGIKVQISHHKAFGRDNWGKVETTLKLIDNYREKGVDVNCDVYPCTFGNTGLYDCMPKWLKEMGRTQFRESIKNKCIQDKVIEDLQKPGKDFENIVYSSGLDRIIICDSLAYPSYIGKSIAKIAQDKNCNCFDIIFDILDKDISVQIICGGMCEGDIDNVISHSSSMICSDSEVTILNEGIPHPRSYMAFTKILRDYVFKSNKLTIQDAVKKMSSMAANKLGINDRGLIKPNYKADLAIFNSKQVDFGSTYTNPHCYSKGMEYVLINGEFVIEDGKFTSELPGKILCK